MSFDDWLLLVHIIAVAAWLGGGIMLSLLASRANKVGQGRNMIDQMEWVGPRIGGPVSLLVPITGV